MATIGATVNEATKREFEAAARARRTSASRLSALLIRDFLLRDEGCGLPGNSLSVLVPFVSPIADGRETKTKQVFVRLEPRYYEALGRLASERQWYRGTYMANLFYAHADQRPVFCDAEINALRQIARHMADMGRNLAQVARILRTSPTCPQIVTTIDFNRLEMLIESESNAVKSLVRSNLGGWGVSDENT